MFGHARGMVAFWVNSFILTCVGNIPIHIFPGTHFIPLKPLAIYEGSIPLSYVFSLNESVQQVQFPLPFPKCLFNKSEEPCRVVEAAHTLEDHILRLLDVPREVSAHTRRRRAVETIGNFLNWCCSTATDGELHTLTSNEEAVNNHLNNLQLIEKLDHKDLVKTSSQLRDFSANVSSVLDSVHDTLVNFRNSLRSDNANLEALYTNLLSLHVRLQTITYRQASFSRVQEMSSHCRDNLIPPSIIPLATLRSDLLNLDQQVSRLNHTLAVPISSIQAYYSLPIVTCISSPSTTIINIRVPIRQVNISWSLFKYLPTPLAWDNQTCHLSHEDIILAKSGTQIRTISGDNLVNCDIKKDKLCFLPRQLAASSLTQTCARLLFQAAQLSIVMNHCDYVCHPKPHQTIVTSISADTFILTHPTKFLRLTCKNFPSSDLPVIPIDVPGAIELVLPCYCALMENNTRLIASSFPCNLPTQAPPPSLRHILPTTWSTLHALKINPRSADHFEWLDLDTILNREWRLKTPSFQIQTHIAPDAFDPVQLPETWYDIHNSTSMHVVFLVVWNVILSILLLYLYFRRYVDNVRYRQPEP